MSDIGMKINVTMPKVLVTLEEALIEEYSLSLEKLGDEAAKLLKYLFKVERIDASRQTSDSIQRSEVLRGVSKLRLTVGPSGDRERVAAYITRGRSPGAQMPPITAILEWMDDKGISTGMTPGQKQRVAFLIARSISRKGIKGRLVFARVRAHIERLAKDEVKAATARAIARAGGA